jgi:short-subunit dehydrogenase
MVRAAAAPGTAPAPAKPAVETALITGASSGIGEALAGCFAGAGFNLVLVARRSELLEVLAERLRGQHGITVWVLAADLAQPGAPANLAGRLRRKRVAVDVLVNCAGVLSQGGFAAMPAGTMAGMVDLNVSGLTAMLAQFVPPMCARGHGRVLNVASIAAFQPVPTLAVYAATKAYVLSLTESLAEELKASGVTVTALCPGITATPMLAHAADANTALSALPALLVGDVADVAAQGFAACLRGDVIVVPGLVNRAATAGGRLLPKWLLRRISGLVSRRLQ